MALTALNAPVPYMPFLPGMYGVSGGGGLGSDATITMNGAGDKIAYVFQATSTTPPDQVKFRVPSFTSTGTIDVTLETVDAATGTPSGTPVTNTNTASVSVASTGTKTVTGLAGTGSMTVGTLYAVVLTAASGFAGNYTILRTTGTNGGSGSPYSLTKDSAGSWTKASTDNTGYALGFLDSGGAGIHMPGFAGAYTAALASFSDSTNPDERGSRFSLPVPVTCVGVAMFATAGSTPADTNSFEVSLYSSHTSGSPTQERNLVIDGDNVATNAFRVFYWPSPIDLAANTAYALAIKATSTSGVGLLRHQYASSAELPCYLDANFYATTRNNGSGAFTDTNTEVYGIYPLISRVHDDAGSGGNTYSRGRVVNP